jgi:hypothetical protein
MLRTLGLILAGVSPLLPVVVLVGLAEWRDRRRAAARVRQIRLTDAITAELGGVVAPVVSKPLAAPWRVALRVPVGRPALVGRLVAIPHDTLGELGDARYELVLTPVPSPARRVARIRPVARRLRVA